MRVDPGCIWTGIMTLTDTVILPLQPGSLPVALCQSKFPARLILKLHDSFAEGTTPLDRPRPSCHYHKTAQKSEESQVVFLCQWHKTGIARVKNTGDWFINN